jgi:Cu(I)/Ag(I) efflux system membrane fusion protein
MAAILTLPYWPGQTFAGTIVFLDPALNPQTRTLRARLDIPNPDLILKPEMFADARLDYSLGEKLAVPEGAMLRTGEHAFAFVQGQGDQIAPREITIGARSEGYFEVLSGLNEGDRVVTSANFLVDSESSLKAALQALTREKP